MSIEHIFSDTYHLRLDKIRYMSGQQSYSKIILYFPTLKWNSSAFNMDHFYKHKFIRTWMSLVKFPCIHDTGEFLR